MITGGSACKLTLLVNCVISTSVQITRNIPTKSLHPHCHSLDHCSLLKEQEVLRRANCLLSFNMTWHRLYRKWCLQQFFIAVWMCSPSHRLVMIGEHTDRPIDSSLIWHGPHRKWHVQQFIFASCIRCCRNMYAKPLCSNNKDDTQTHILMEGFYEVYHWQGLRCHAIHTKFHKGWFRHSKPDGWDTATHTQWRSQKPGFIFFFKIRETG
jgi:hypothetical protein